MDLPNLSNKFLSIPHMPSIQQGLAVTRDTTGLRVIVTPDYNCSWVRMFSSVLL